MIQVVLDASAILALLRNERGAEAVSDKLAGSLMTTVTLSEVVSYYARTGASEGQIRPLLDNLQTECVPFDEDLAYLAGLLLPKTRPAGLSFGDRACLALAKRLGATALTADRSWQRIAGAIGAKVELIR